LSGSEPPLFLIAKDSQGNWVVQDQSGLHGGLFVDRAEALKFAMFENGNRPQAVVMVPGVLELDMSVKPRVGQRLRPTGRAFFGLPRSDAQFVLRSDQIVDPM
jgi:hypothetical protein